MKNRARWGRRATFTIGITLGFAYVFPFFLVFVNALKLKYDILANPLALPVSITWENFQQAYTKMEFFRSLTNIRNGAINIFISRLHHNYSNRDR